MIIIIIIIILTIMVMITIIIIMITIITKEHKSSNLPLCTQDRVDPAY